MKELESAQPLEASVVESPYASNLPHSEVSQPWWYFVTSTRFWVMVIGALAIYGQQKGWLGEAEMQLIATLSGLFIGIRTVDRIGEQLAKA